MAVFVFVALPLLRLMPGHVGPRWHRVLVVVLIRWIGRDAVRAKDFLQNVIEGLQQNLFYYKIGSVRQKSEHVSYHVYGGCVTVPIKEIGI